jgi:hypothetical protein
MFGPPNAVRLKVSLDEIEPAVRRRLVVPSEWNLEQLQLVIQADSQKFPSSTVASFRRSQRNASLFKP